MTRLFTNSARSGHSLYLQRVVGGADVVANTEEELPHQREAHGLENAELLQKAGFGVVVLSWAVRRALQLLGLYPESDQIIYKFYQI